MMQTSDIWQPLAEGQVPRVYEAGQFIYWQDTIATEFYYIVSGKVKCFLSAPSGAERTLTVHQTGALIGEASFFDGQPRVSSAIALTRCEIVTIDRVQLEETFRRCPELPFSMLQYLAKTVRLLSGHVDGTFLRADRRIARYLLSQPTEEDGILSCTHEEIGFAVGVSRVTVSRVLGALERNGFLETGYHHIRLRNRKALDSLVHSLPEEC
ncbi:MAG: Crp/Fnr family transcriptional regulator [Oscillospiraceae bacterium]|nr:Crp/Fnr family transcriptional regulator [Oscillospiraceae bacterium]